MSIFIKKIDYSKWSKKQLVNKAFSIDNTFNKAEYMHDSRKELIEFIESEEGQ